MNELYISIITQIIHNHRSANLPRAREHKCNCKSVDALFYCIVSAQILKKNTKTFSERSFAYKLHHSDRLELAAGRPESFILLPKFQGQIQNL